MCMVIIAALIKAGSTGSVAHLGERLHGMEEVEGSIPFRSTRIMKLPPFIGPFRYNENWGFLL